MVATGPTFYGSSGPAVSSGQTPRGRGSWTANRLQGVRQNTLAYGDQHYVATPSGLRVVSHSQPARRFRFIRGLMGIGLYTVRQVPRIVDRHVEYRDGYLFVYVRLDLPGGLVVAVEAGARPVAYREVLEPATEHRLQLPLPHGTVGELLVHLEAVASG